VKLPLPMYNNDIYLRDRCDPYAGLGYYGHAGNSGNVATPQKKYFADHDFSPVVGIIQLILILVKWLIRCFSIRKLRKST